MDQQRLAKAAKAAYPELWPDSGEEPRGYESSAGKANLAVRRQAALGRVVKALEIYEGAVGEEAAIEQAEVVTPLTDFVVGLPEDAAMVQQVLTTVTYLNHEGQTAYVVRTMGEGLRTSWLGMCVLTQDYLLRQPYASREDEDDDG